MVLSLYFERDKLFIKYYYNVTRTLNGITISVSWPIGNGDVNVENKTVM